MYKHFLRDYLSFGFTHSPDSDFTDTVGEILLAAFCLY